MNMYKCVHFDIRSYGKNRRMNLCHNTFKKKGQKHTLKLGKCSKGHEGMYKKTTTLIILV